MRINIKKIALIICIISICSLSIAAVNHYSSPKSALEKGQYLNLLENSRDNSKIVVKVNGTSITENDIKIAGLFRDDDLPYDQLLNRVIKNELLLQEANRLGINVSLDEAKSFAQEVRTILESSPNEDSEEVSEIISGLGMSPDEYWTEFAPLKYQEVLLLGEVRNYIGENAVSEFMKDNELSKDGNSSDETQAIYLNAIENTENILFENSTLEYLD